VIKRRPEGAAFFLEKNPENSNIILRSFLPGTLDLKNPAVSIIHVETAPAIFRKEFIP
jgi:hypothetical protein